MKRICSSSSSESELPESELSSFLAFLATTGAFSGFLVSSSSSESELSESEFSSFLALLATTGAFFSGFLDSSSSSSSLSEPEMIFQIPIYLDSKIDFKRI